MSGLLGYRKEFAGLMGKMDLGIGEDGRYVLGQRYGHGEQGNQVEPHETGGLSYSPRRARSHTQNPRAAGVTVSPKVTMDGRSAQNFSRDQIGPEKRSEGSDMKATEAKIRHLAEKYSGGGSTPNKLAAPQRTEKVKIHELLKNNPSGKFPKDSENHIFIANPNLHLPPFYTHPPNSDNPESSHKPYTSGPHTDQSAISPTSHTQYHPLTTTYQPHTHPKNLDTPPLDCKIFWEQTFANFLERNFGLQFAEPGEIWRIRQIPAEICRICQICPATLKINLNCDCSSENSPMRHS